MLPAIGSRDCIAGTITSGDVEDSKPAPDVLPVAL